MSQHSAHQKRERCGSLCCQSKWTLILPASFFFITCTYKLLVALQQLQLFIYYERLFAHSQAYCCSEAYSTTGESFNADCQPHQVFSKHYCTVVYLHVYMYLYWEGEGKGAGRTVRGERVREGEAGKGGGGGEVGGTITLPWWSISPPVMNMCGCQLERDFHYCIHALSTRLTFQ